MTFLTLNNLSSENSKRLKVKINLDGGEGVFDI